MPDGEEDGSTEPVAVPVSIPATEPTGGSEDPQEQVRGNLGSTRSRAEDEQRQPIRPRYVAPFFSRAAQPEIIRANQKDLYYLTQLTDQIEDVARGIFGTRWLQTFATEVGLASRMAYYGLTTLLGTQTLGEEYVDILQYEVKTRKIPTILSRCLLLTSHILAPYFLARAYTTLKRVITQSRARQQTIAPTPSQSRNVIQPQEDPLFADEQQTIAQLPLPDMQTSDPSAPTSASTRLPLTSLLSDVELPTFESLMDEHVRAIHLAVFYLFGRYYHVAKRLLGIRYLSLQSRQDAGGAGGSSRPPSYEVLGVLMAVQMGVRLISLLIRRRNRAKEASKLNDSHKVGAAEKAESGGKEQQRQVATIDGQSITELAFDPEDPTMDGEEEADQEVEVVESRRCTLCLGPRRDPASTECGHCFCYTCIVAWAREKAECPLCRSKVNLSRILPLYNV